MTDDQPTSPAGTPAQADPQPPHVVTHPCPVCQAPVHVDTTATGRPRVYCSRRCRNRASEQKRHARLQQLNVEVQLAAQGKHHPCGWCGANVPGREYCSMVCDQLHHEMMALQARLRGLRRSTPVPGLAAKFDQLDRMRATRNELRAAARARLEGPVQQRLAQLQQREATRAKRESVQQIARRRLEEEAARKAERIARRKGENVN